MNSVLQSLLHCQPLVNYILNGESDLELKDIQSKVQRKEQVYTPFREFVKEYWTGKHNVMDPGQLKKKQGALDERWKGMDDASALTFFYVCLCVLSMRFAICFFRVQFLRFANASGWEQHDAQEYLVFLLYCLHEDLNRQTAKHPRLAVDEKLAPCEQAAMEWHEELQVANSFLSDIMMGTIN
jgi:ubiquitin C-terminal hydrolase